LSCGRRGSRQARLHTGTGRPSRQPQAPLRHSGRTRARNAPPCAGARRWRPAAARHPCMAARPRGLEARRRHRRRSRQRAGAPSQVAVHQDNTHRPMDLRAGAAQPAAGNAAGAPADWPLLAAASEIAAEARAAVKAGGLTLPFRVPPSTCFGAQRWPARAAPPFPSQHRRRAAARSSLHAACAAAPLLETHLGPRRRLVGGRHGAVPANRAGRPSRGGACCPSFKPAGRCHGVAPLAPRAGPGSEAATGVPAAGGGGLPCVGGHRVQPHAGQAGRGPAQAGRPDRAAAERGGRVRGRPAGARPRPARPPPPRPGAGRAAGEDGPAGARLAGQEAKHTIHASPRRRVKALEASAEATRALNGTISRRQSALLGVPLAGDRSPNRAPARCARCPASATRSRRS
jgi:hypothetical protein